MSSIVYDQFNIEWAAKKALLEQIEKAILEQAEHKKARQMQATMEWEIYCQRCKDKLVKILKQIPSYRQLLCCGEQVLGDSVVVSDFKTSLDEILQDIEAIIIRTGEDFIIKEECLKSGRNIANDFTLKIDKLLEPAAAVLRNAVHSYAADKAEASFASAVMGLQPGRHKEYLLDQAEAQRKLVAQAAQALCEMIRPYTFEEMLDNREELQSLLLAVEDIADNDSLDAVYKYKQIILRQKAFFSTKHQYDREIELNRKNVADYKKAWEEYDILCTLLQKERPKEWTEISLKDAEQAASALQAQNQVLKKELEMRMVAEKIHKVMEEMGFAMLDAEFVSMPNRDIVHGIFKFGDNAVNTYTSDNGSILFEVTGIAAEQREGRQLTALEKLKIKEDMARFCPVHQKIQHKLAELGITVKTNNLYPADEKYAKVIGVGAKYKAVKEERGAKGKADYMAK